MGYRREMESRQKVSGSSNTARHRTAHLVAIGVEWLHAPGGIEGDQKDQVPDQQPPVVIVPLLLLILCAQSILQLEKHKS